MCYCLLLWQHSRVLALQLVCDQFQGSWIAMSPGSSPLCCQCDPLTPCGISSLVYRGNASFEYLAHHQQSGCQEELCVSINHIQGSSSQCSLYQSIANAGSLFPPMGWSVAGVLAPSLSSQHSGVIGMEKNTQRYQLWRTRWLPLSQLVLKSSKFGTAALIVGINSFRARQSTVSSLDFHVGHMGLLKGKQFQLITSWLSNRQIS